MIEILTTNLINFCGVTVNFFETYTSNILAITGYFLGLMLFAFVATLIFRKVRL